MDALSDPTAMMQRPVTYSAPLRSEFSVFTPAEQLARLQHEAYERHACTEYGYLPRLWEQLTEADQRLRVDVAKELLMRSIVTILPNCEHVDTSLVRIEARKCNVCGTFPRLCRYTGEELEEDEQ